VDFAAWKQHQAVFEQPGKREFIFSVLPGSRVDRLIEQPGSNFFLATWLLAACPESNTSSELQPRANTKEPPNLSVRGFIV
jgi:hypothetical protein